MLVKVRKVGTSLTLTIPSPIAKSIGISIGDIFDITETQEGLNCKLIESELVTVMSNSISSMNKLEIESEIINLKNGMVKNMIEPSSFSSAVDRFAELHHRLAELTINSKDR